MKTLLVALGALTLGGCAVTPLIDQAGVPPGRFILVNQTATNIYGVNIDRCSGSMSDGNRLARGEIIYRGDQKIFELSPGCWENNFSGKMNIISGKDFKLTVK